MDDYPEYLIDMIMAVAFPLAIKEGYGCPVPDEFSGLKRAFAEMLFYDYLDHGNGD